MPIAGTWFRHIWSSCDDVFPIVGVSARCGPALLANVCFSKRHFTSPCISLESGFPPSFLVTSFGDGSRISSSEKASRFHAELNAHLLGSPPLRELLRVRSHHVHCSSWHFCCPWLSSPLNSAAYFCAPRISYNFMSGQMFDKCYLNTRMNFK